MAKINVEVVETLRRTVHIEAASEGEAVEKAKDLYYSEEIILDSGDFMEVEFY